jgi:hypothetical protein
LPWNLYRMLQGHLLVLSASAAIFKTLFQNNSYFTDKTRQRQRVR